MRAQQPWRRAAANRAQLPLQGPTTAARIDPLAIEPGLTDRQPDAVVERTLYIGRVPRLQSVSASRSFGTPVTSILLAYSGTGSDRRNWANGGQMPGQRPFVLVSIATKHINEAAT